MTKNLLRQIQFIAGIIALMLVTLTFQNCGRIGSESSLLTGSTDNNKSNDLLSFFEYPYSKAPVVYGQVQFAAKDATAGFSDVVVFATVGKADGSVATFDYKLTVTNENDFPVCPMQAGRLTAGATSVISSCTSQVNSSKVKVVLQANLVEGEKSTPYSFSHTYTDLAVK